MRFVRSIGTIAAMSAVVLAIAAADGSAQGQTSKPFSGPKVNGGTVTHAMAEALLGEAAFERTVLTRAAR